MSKSFLAVVGVAALVCTSFYVSTQVGLQTEGWHDVTVEMPRNPGYAAVGQTYFTPDGSKLLVTSVRRDHGKHIIDARIQGTHRYVVGLFPLRLDHSFAMDRPSMEWTLRQAFGSNALLGRPGGREWHVLD
jgi:hypothetical protein